MILFLHTLTLALNNGVGLTPAMGWNSWNRFRCEGLNEELILEVAHAMVSSGLRDAGYKYVNIDDCWMEKRAADGHIIPFASKFPSGMKSLGDKIHALGLRFGIYSCAGEKTCEGWPGSYGHEAIDAADYASWGVDYLKYDFCGFEKVKEHHDPRHYYSLMRDALNATGRPILYSMCNWGVGSPHLWGHEVAHSWRTGRDVFAAWDEHAARTEMRLPGFLQSIETAVEQQLTYAPNARPGGFNDPDMLVVGLDGMTPYGIVDECPSHLPPGSCKKGDYVSRELWGKVGGLTITEQKTQFSLWCLLASPLMLGNDPRTMNGVTKRILTATELIAINQDSLGVQASRVHIDEEPSSGRKISIWHKPLADGTHALLLFNNGLKPASITVKWERDLPTHASKYAVQVEREPPCVNKHDDKACDGWAKGGECSKNPGFMKSGCQKACETCAPALYEGAQATALVRNAWEREDEGLFVAMYTAMHVEPHEARVVTVRFGERPELERRLATNLAAAVKSGGGGAGGVAHMAAATAHATPHVASLSGQEQAGMYVPKCDVAKPTHAEHEPPTMHACAAEHSDRLVLGSVGLVGLGAGLMMLLRVMGCGKRSKVPAPAALRTALHKDRPHAV